VAPAGGDRVTRGIMIVTVLAWGAVTLGGWTDVAVQWGGFIPLRLTDDVKGFSPIPALLTPLSAALLHGGLFHLAMNMVMLWFCGRQVEQVVGSKVILPVYVIGAYAAALAQYALNTSSPVPMVGASGAISALIGVYAVMFSRSETKAIGPIPAYWVRVLWLAAGWTGLQWLIGLSGMGGSMPIAIGAHIGGFLAGVLMVRPLLRWRYRDA
jgi:membrane associated rhomboid family serine protease